MDRRAFLGTLAGGLLAEPLAAEAQQAANVARIGWLGFGVRSARPEDFLQGLRELGYVEGRNVVIEYRSAEGKLEQLPTLAAELVSLKVDVIVAQSTAAALAAKQATQAIPIVFGAVSDPVGTGLVASLAHPGGNITGLAVLNAELSAKRFEVLKEVVPGLARAAVLWNAANPANALAWRETEGAAHALGVALASREVREPKDFAGAFAALARERPDALLVLQDALTLQTRKEIIEFTLRERLPGMFVGKEWAQEGGLMSYGDRLPDRYRRAAQIVDRILKGEKPADIPVDQPTNFELVVNLRTATAIGLTIPETFLTRADEVIE